MNGTQPNILDEQAVTMYCPQCGKPMRVASEHLRAPVACPHCDHAITPWNTLEATNETHPVTPPASPSRPMPHGFPPDLNGSYSWRSRWVAGVLGILLGPLGVHRFYLGFPGIGILQIFLTFITFGIAGVWGFIEGVLCLVGAMRDAEGLPLRE